MVFRASPPCDFFAIFAIFIFPMHVQSGKYTHIALLVIDPLAAIFFEKIARAKC